MIGATGVVYSTLSLVFAARRRLPPTPHVAGRIGAVASDAARSGDGPSTLLHFQREHCESALNRSCTRCKSSVCR